MATPGDIAIKALRKLKVIGIYDVAEAQEAQRAITAVEDAHRVLSTQGLTQWTLQDIPDDVEFSYVQMSAYLMADDFSQPKQPEWMAQGIAQVQAHVYLKPSQPVYADDF